MSEDKRLKTIEESKEWKAENGEWIWILPLFMLFGFGWNSPENLRVNELEKKVSRIEGQMSMIGGKLHE